MSALLITIGRLRADGHAALERYADGVMPIIAAAGGEVVSRGRPTETVVADGGDGQPDLVAIIRFATIDAIRSFLASSDYQAHVEDRQTAFAELRSYIAEDLTIPGETERRVPESTFLSPLGVDMTVTGFRRLSSFIGALAFFIVTVAAAGKSMIDVSRGQLALRGYDAVSYIADGKAVQGASSFEYRWMDATWRFASAEHRDRFMKEPQRYAPQFGGYCAYAVSQGHTAEGDPRVWRVVDGRLYLNYSTSVQKLWEQDVPGNIGKGQRNWPSVLTK